MTTPRGGYGPRNKCCQDPSLTCPSDCNWVSKAPGVPLLTQLHKPRVQRHHFTEFISISCFDFTHTQDLCPKDWIEFYRHLLGGPQKRCNDDTLSGRKPEENANKTQLDSLMTARTRLISNSKFTGNCQTQPNNIPSQRSKDISKISAALGLLPLRYNMGGFRPGPCMMIEEEPFQLRNASLSHLYLDAYAFLFLP